MCPLTKKTFEVQIKPLGDSALVVQLASIMSEEAHVKVMQFIQTIEKIPFEGFSEAVPAYINVTIFYDPFIVFRTYGANKTVYETVADLMREYPTTLDTYSKEKASLIEIPVIYGGEFGPDFAYVAKKNNLTEQEVITMHTENNYLAYMIGFAPGFPFLGGMNARIEAPRKATPRGSVPARSVGIAGKQTGVYPFESPGGCQIIGRTPIELFIPEQQPPTRIQPGDWLRFVPVDHEEWKERVHKWPFK